MKHLITLTIVLFGVWLLWSGHYTSLLVTMGALSTLLVAWLVHRMGLADEETVPAWLTLRAWIYAPWLFWEVAKSNVAVARRILAPSLPIRPSLMRVKAGQRTDLGRVIYANSITLTPGTVSVDVEGDTITVHALTDEAAEGLASGEMDRRVCAVEGRR